MATKKTSVTHQEFGVIKTLIHAFSNAIENVIENDISQLDQDTELYLSLLDLNEVWESNEIRDAMEAWIDIDH